jgi:hypothetical protein
MFLSLSIMSLNSFGPFNSEVWGTVSDWGIFSLTIVTAIYFMRTYAAQAKTLKLQVEHNHFEMLKYKNAIRPHFILELNNRIDFQLGWETKPSTFILIAKVSNNQVVKNIHIETVIKDPINWNWEHSHIKEIPTFETHQSIKFEYKHTEGFPLNKFVARSNEFQILIRFEDVVGTNYIQRFELIYFKNNLQLTQGPPIEVE